MSIHKHARCNCVIRFFKRASVISLLLAVGFYPFTVDAFDILLGTGGEGTFSHFTGRTICRIINKYAVDIACKAVPASDDVHNLTNLQGGSLDIGLIDSRMLHDAINKTGNFEFLDISYDNIRSLVPLYDVPVALVVRTDANIDSLEKLKGKRINAGAPRSAQHLAVETIMKAKNWSKDDFSLVEELPTSQSQDTMAFCHGTVQAMVQMGVHPDTSLHQLFRLCKADLVNMEDHDIEKLVSDHPAFSKMEIAASTYPHQPEGVRTFGTRAVLVVSQDLDEQTVYRIMDTIYNNRARLSRAHPAIRPFSGEKRKDAGLELHSGAAKYFMEHGL